MKRILTSLVLLLVLLGLAADVQAQTVVNPTIAEFDCPEHATDVQHELKFISVVGTNKVVISTILLGDPPLMSGTNTTNRVRVSINVMPVAHGDYVSRVNAIVDTPNGPVKSEDSAESNPWRRAPGRPDRLTIGSGGQ